MSKKYVGHAKVVEFKWGNIVKVWINKEGLEVIGKESDDSRQVGDSLSL